MKHIGILAHSAEGATLCYRTMWMEGVRRLGAHRHPEITLRDAYVRIIGKLAGQGCDAVALVCTEAPLLITADVSPLPILDSTRLLARAAVDVAIGERPMPEWYGGPVAERMAAE
ncbi:MAG TPA: hypothetical protein VE221_09010 [Sphingomicrobium sp.]|jgi:aspartate/glutamate racemase|nr:hypothetical protein [Sphingomicrobium sp.]